MSGPFRSLRLRSILSLPAGAKGGPIHIPGDVRRRLRQKYGNEFMTSVDPRDEMYRFLESHPGIENPAEAYFESGESLHESLLSALQEATFYPGVSSALMDFACGYGRLARFLVKDVGPQNVTVADIDARAVDFCMSKWESPGSIRRATRASWSTMANTMES
ncbi:MAG: methyltransferase [Anaerolineales bacterium]